MIRSSGREQETTHLKWNWGRPMSYSGNLSLCFVKYCTKPRKTTCDNQQQIKLNEVFLWNYQFKKIKKKIINHIYNLAEYDYLANFIYTDFSKTFHKGNIIILMKKLVQMEVANEFTKCLYQHRLDEKINTNSNATTWTTAARK